MSPPPVYSFKDDSFSSAFIYQSFEVVLLQNVKIDIFSISVQTPTLNKMFYTCFINAFASW